MKFKKKWIILIAALVLTAVVLWFLPDLFGNGKRQLAVPEQTESKQENRKCFSPS